MDWTLISRYVAPILALYVGAILNRRLERRARLVTYFSHANAVQIKPPQGIPITVHTHSVVVQNVGRAAASNVKICHAVLPDFSIYPDVEMKVVELPGGAKEIQIPMLVPDEQIAITYLYLPPLYWHQINSGIKSDSGIAKTVVAMPTRQYPAWVGKLVIALAIIGAAALAYGSAHIVQYSFRIVGGQ